MDTWLDKQKFPLEEYVCYPGACRWKASDLLLGDTELVGSSDDSLSKLTCTQEFEFINMVNVTKCLRM